MPLSAEEQKTLEDLQRKASEPDSVDIWVRNESGKAIQVSGAYARKLLQEFGLEDPDPEPDGDGDGDGGGGKPKAEPKPPSGHRFFQ